MPECATCGAEIRSGARFCSSCGTPRPGDSPVLLNAETPALLSLNGQPADQVPAVGSRPNGMDIRKEAPAVHHTAEHAIDNASISLAASHPGGIADTDEHAAISVTAPQAPEPQAPDAAGAGHPQAISPANAEPASRAATSMDTAARDTGSGALANVLIAATTAVVVALLTLGLDRVLRNASTYFTADIVIAVATGVLLWGALLLLSRWERRRT